MCWRHRYPPNRVDTTQAVNPPQQLIDSLLRHYQTGEFSKAEKLAASFTQKFPHVLGWRILGAILGQTDRNAVTLSINQKVVSLSPQDTTTHNNLGITLKDLGKLEEAEESYKQAIKIKFDFAEAHNQFS